MYLMTNIIFTLDLSHSLRSSERNFMGSAIMLILKLLPGKTV